MIGNRFFIVYDCRDYKGDYLGRFILVYGSLDEIKDEPPFKEVRAALDSHSILRRACSWRIKEVDSAILADFMEDFL